jgi:hypothetical protein
MVILTNEDVKKKKEKETTSMDAYSKIGRVQIVGCQFMHF